MTAVLLEARNIGRRAPLGEDWLLRNVSLGVCQDDRVAIIGPSGSGKTLLLRALALLDPVDTGEILWKGESLADAAVPEFRRQVMYLHQRPALMEGTVEAVLRQPFDLQVHQDRQFDNDRVVDLLRNIDRDKSFLRKSTRDLSGGEAQIVALIRAIQLDPTLLLLDEPTAALDAPTAASTEQLILRWYEESASTRALVWVSHNTRQVQRVANKTLRMKAGAPEQHE